MSKFKKCIKYDKGTMGLFLINVSFSQTSYGVRNFSLNLCYHLQQYFISWNMGKFNTSW